MVDDGFARHGALLARGDDTGAAAALDLLSGHFPNLWEPGKPYLSLEEIRYDLHRFFSLRSGAGQAAVGLYHLDRWMKEIGGAPVKNVKAELFVDLADPHLTDFVRGQIQDRSASRRSRSRDQQPACRHAVLRARAERSLSVARTVVPYIHAQFYRGSQ